MSFVGILGSKTGVREQLIGMMPPEAFGACYVELFAGGAGVYYGKEPARINVLNDLDPDTVVMHQAVQRDAQAVEAELRLLLDDDSTFEEFKRLRESQEWDRVPEARRAAMVIYRYKQSLNSNQNDLSSSSKTRSSFNPNLSLAEFGAKLQRAQIRHFHYARCIDVYFYHSAEAEGFLFADPPYVVADKRMHYRFNFHPVEHIRFWHTMTRLSKDNGPKRNVKIMITYDDVPLIRALFRQADGWRVFPLAIGYNSALDPAANRSEVVITNYDPPTLSTPVVLPSVAPPGSGRIPTGQVDWSDIPAEGVDIDGVPFAELSCCDRERVGLLIKSKRLATCRVCGQKVRCQPQKK